MIAPDQVSAAAQRMERKNIKFRSFLKNHADEKQLDAQFYELHNELFKDYDCSKCRNCCKMYNAEISTSDLEKDAACLNMSVGDFVETFLKTDQYGISYMTKHKPCDFLQENGECMLGENKPESCVKYPYTDQPERLHSLLSFLGHIWICPVAFEIYERLKKMYNFR